MLAYGRFNEKGGHSLIVINNSDHDIDKVFKVWYLGVPKECEMQVLIKTTKDGFETPAQTIPVTSGKINIKLGPKSGIILRFQDDTPEEAVTKSNTAAAKYMWR